MGFHRKTRVAVAIALCICLTGCSNGLESVLDYQSENGVGKVDLQTNQQEYLSKEICVIPANKQSKKDPVITAGSALIVNDSTNEMLFSKAIYKKLYPASITKIVTALVTFKKANLDDTVTFSYDATHITEYGAKVCGFAEGDQIKLKDLLYCFLVYSGNDAGMAIAEHVGGNVKRFSKMMNQEMADLGASGSHFVNPHGLQDEKHYTTAYDLYLVFHELIKYPVFQDIINQSSYTAKYQSESGESKELTFQSTDHYLVGTSTAPKGVKVIGGKTGTTLDAGSCLILYSQDKHQQDYISIVMHADSSYALYTQMNHLLEFIVK